MRLPIWLIVVGAVVLVIASLGAGAFFAGRAFVNGIFRFIGKYL